jgi:putative phosphoesterase
VIIAVLGDIHGNASALKAVLEDIESIGIMTIFHTGDCVCGQAGNHNVIDLLHEFNVQGVQGQWDHRLVRYIRKRKTQAKKLSEADLALLEQAYHECGSAHMEYLGALPRMYRATIDGIAIAVCHGTINSQRESLRGDDDDNKFKRQRELEPARIIVSGRTHTPHEKLLGDTLFVNPGSLGQHEDGLAHYAIISTEKEPWTVEFKALKH